MSRFCTLKERRKRHKSRYCTLKERRKRHKSRFCTLKERRKRHKLIQFHKFHQMMNNACPDYLSDLLPPVALTTNPYHRRRPYERIVPPFRTELYRNSFFPSTTLLYFLASSSISEVRCCLTMNNGKVPSYYYSGKRIGQIIHCRLRRDLNFDLVSGHHTDNPLCACGHPLETAKHL